MDSLTPFSLQCIPTVLDFSSITNACSAKPARQHASTLIWEEIYKLKENIRAYEKQILSWKEEITSWKTRQNALTDVATLPDDILLEIWSYIAEVAAESPEMQREWLRVTQVCSSWRKLALNTQALWRWPCILVPDLARHLLARIRDIPISLVVNVSLISASSRDVFSLACQLLPRAGSLTLRADTTLNLDRLDGCSQFGQFLESSGPYPKLRSLTVAYNRAPSRHPTPREININRLVMSAPALVRIDLCNTGMFTLNSSPRVPLPLITNLFIGLSDSRHGVLQQICVRQAIRIIELLPSLLRLSLVDVFKAVSDEDREWSKTRTTRSLPLLANLRTLWVGACVEETHFFISHISYTPSTEVTAAIGAGVRGIDLSALEQLLATTTSIERTGAPITALDIILLEGSFNMVYSITFYLRELRYPQWKFRIWLPKAFLAPLRDLPHICPLQHLDILRYNLDRSDINMWKGFGRLPRLRFILEVEIYRHPTLMKVLSIHRPSGDSIFEPFTSPGGRKHREQNQNVAENVPLYYPNLATIQSSDRASSNEELDRIFAARNAWYENEGCISLP